MTAIKEGLSIESLRRPISKVGADLGSQESREFIKQSVNK